MMDHHAFVGLHLARAGGTWIGTLHEENIHLVAQELKRILQHPYQLYFRERVLDTPLRPAPCTERAESRPQVGIARSSDLVCLVVQAPHHETWEVPVASGLSLDSEQEAYFLTPGGQEYLVQVTG
jgi:hypothetical protein